MTGGSYIMARKIRMTLEVWDRVRLSEQEQIIGRDKRYGAPLSVTEPSAEAEFEPLDLSAQGEDGPAIPEDSHVAIVAPENNDGRRMLRRGYNYTDGNDSWAVWTRGCSSSRSPAIRAPVPIRSWSG